MNRRRGSWEQGRVASQRRESDPLGAFIRQKRQPLANIGDRPSIVRQPSVNPDGWPVDLLISCVVAASGTAPLGDASSSRRAGNQNLSPAGEGGSAVGFWVRTSTKCG